MRRKIILVTLLIVGVLLCTGPLWGLLATASGMVGMLERVSGNDEMAAVALFSIAGWIALPLGLATVTGIVLVIARVRKRWIVVGMLAPMILGGVVVGVMGPILVILSCIVAEQNSGPFNELRLTAIVQQVKTIRLRPGEKLELRLDDLANPKSLRKLKPNEIFPGQGDGSVWAEVTADGKLKVVIETKDLGHAGSYGYAYTEAGPPKQVTDWGGYDLPGPLCGVDKKVAEHWWAVKNPMGG
ncbi:MAG: hypothetical protein ACLQLG_00215 [Thermoguttaceae bacterium]